MQSPIQWLVQRFPSSWRLYTLFILFVLISSLVRRFRLSKQTALVDAVATSIGFVALDALPFSPDERRSFAIPLNWPVTKVRNIIQGSVGGKEVVLFDSETHKSRSDRLQTIAAFRVSGKALPDFLLQPKRVLGRVLTRCGKSVDFGPCSDFSRDYFLTSGDETATRACFTPACREFFEGLERFDSKKNWHLQKHGDWLVIYRPDEGLQPDELQTFLEATAEIVRNLEGATTKT
jgi:hypothetical protein